MNILLFSSDAQLCTELREETKAGLVSVRQEATVLSLQEAKSALEELTSNARRFDLVVLDLETIGDLSPLHRLFRIGNPSCHVITVSDTYRNLNSILLYLRPTALLRKPVSLRQYAECLRFILAEYRASGRCFQFRDKSLGKRIPLRDIIYFESSQHNVILHTLRQGAYTFRAKLDDVEHGLHHARFLRCHQSYLVNFENIRGVEQPERRFLLSNGEHIDISRRSYPATLEAYNIFLAERENRF